jgi:endonuclease-3
MSASSPRRKAAQHKTDKTPAAASTNVEADVSFPLPTHDSTSEKPVGYIIQNLERTYGVPENKRASDPLDMLIGIILSQATSDVNSHRTFAALKKRFPTWEAALRARTTTIADTIRSGGLANQKAEVIKSVLRQIKDEHGTLDLNFLHDLTAGAAVEYLSQFRGIGPKTVACTLLFACRKDVFPLDTHIFRILRRVGLIPQKCTDQRAHAIMDDVVPRGKFYSFHVNLIRHGRALCRPREPLCERCPIVEYCDYGQSLI